MKSDVPFLAKSNEVTDPPRKWSALCRGDLVEVANPYVLVKERSSNVPTSMLS
jgi:hypothetical protein